MTYEAFWHTCLDWEYQAITQLKKHPLAYFTCLPIPVNPPPTLLPNAAAYFFTTKIKTRKTWTVPGEEVDGTADTLRGLIWRQLNAGNRVWLTGHSKGGAVATTAASRLLLGDCVVDSELPDPAVRRPEGRMVSVVGSPLSRLSVFTFNAPMSFARPLAALYDAILARVRGEHVRFEHRADRVRKLPPGGEMVHVGERQLEGEGVLEDPGVLAGGAVAIGGMAIALILAAFKITKSH